MAEPKVQIGDHVLTEAQAMAVRVAISDLHLGTADPSARDALGPIADAYHAQLSEVLKIWLSC